MLPTADVLAGLLVHPHARVNSTASKSASSFLAMRDESSLSRCFPASSRMLLSIRCERKSREWAFVGRSLTTYGGSVYAGCRAVVTTLAVHKNPVSPIKH